MSVLQYLLDAFETRANLMLNPGSPFSAASLAGALLVLTWLLARRGAGRSIKAFCRHAFPARIFLHRSTRMDIAMFVGNAVLLGGAYALMVVASPFWSGRALLGLQTAFGEHEPLHVPSIALLAIVSLVDILAIELGYWLAHFLMHRIPVLWEFHKVHHSAEVMTPLTEWRQHPVEMVLFPNLIGLSTGIAYALLVYLFGFGAQPLLLWQVNVLFLPFFLTISHLRHSHVWLPLTGWAGRIIHSPAHHQIHHSTKPAHFDKNLGFSLSVWDWAFGTLFVPAKREALTFGIDHGREDHDRLDKSFVLPFVRAFQHLRPNRNRPGPP